METGLHKPRSLGSLSTSKRLFNSIQSPYSGHHILQMMSLVKMLGLNLLLPALVAAHATIQPCDPIVHLVNGSLLGVHDSAWSQDHFLGIPYAQPPVGGLRFSIPESLNQTWEEPLLAKDYGSACISYGVSPSSPEIQVENSLTARLGR